eukprot:scaffold6412_cov153-Isochrysis_galbana.AAC.4
MGLSATLQRGRGAVERTHHFGECPVILGIFSNLNRIVPIPIQDPIAVLFAFPESGKGVRHIAIIIWKLIIQHFYSIQGATAPTNSALIWAKALRRFAVLSLRYEESISRMAREKQDRDKPFHRADKRQIQPQP